MRGGDATPHPAHGHLLGWGEWRDPPLGVSLPVPPQALLQPMCFATRRPVSCPPLFSSYHLSFLDSLGCYRPGWRHSHHKTFPAARELSSPRPPPLALGSRGAWCSLLRLSLLTVSSIPDGGMCRATKDISKFPSMWMLDEPSLLIAESCCSKERFLYSY